ncbi:MAG: hypothetical protein ABSH47_17245 [Bryobacteraceae bacterium]|jgi:hypothetical protein
MGVWMSDWSTASMAVISGYFDASGSASGTDVVAVAGLASTPDRWLRFDHDWNECLADHRVSALHMKDFTQSRREFSGWNIDEPKRKRFLAQLLWVIETWIDFTAACAVDIPLYNSADKEYALSEVMRPYSLASFTCVVNIRAWVETKGHSRGDVAYFFEHGDEDQDDLRRCWSHLAPSLIVDPIFLTTAVRL